MNVRSWLAGHRRNPVMRGLAQVCRRFLRAYDNEHNWDLLTNGEAFFARAVLAAQPGVVFDVGANVGDYAQMAAALPGAETVHAFELSPPTFARLQANCAGVAGIVLNPFGLGEKDETVQIYHAPGASDRSSLYPVQDGYARDRLAAQVRTGDGYMAEQGIERVALLKIDVEGHDLATLRGFGEALRAGRIAAVQFEHGGPSVEARVFLRDLAGFLEAAGLRCFRLFPSFLEPLGEWTAEMEVFSGRNYVALTPELERRLAGMIAGLANVVNVG